MSFVGTLSGLVVAWLLLLTVGSYILREQQKQSVVNLQKDMAKAFHVSEEK